MAVGSEEALIVSRRLDRLRKLFAVNNKIYGIVHEYRPNHSVVQILMVNEGRIEDVTRAIALACGLRILKLGIRIGGSGHGPVQCVAEHLAPVLGLTVEFEQIYTTQL